MMGVCLIVTFEKQGNVYSSNYYINENRIYALSRKESSKFYFSKDEENEGSNEDENESFLSCVASHEGTAVGFLTSACAGITSFIPFMQPIAFACAAETAVIASIVSADCAGAF